MEKSETPTKMMSAAELEAKWQKEEDEKLEAERKQKEEEERIKREEEEKQVRIGDITLFSHDSTTDCSD